MVAPPPFSGRNGDMKLILAAYETMVVYFLQCSVLEDEQVFIETTDDVPN